MHERKLASLTIISGHQFSDSTWLELVNRMSCIFGFKDKRFEQVLKNKNMKLTAAIPFLAGCRNPKRIAISHLSIYLIASSNVGKDIFSHNFTDNNSLFTRLERISHFDGGDETIIQRGMNLLALAMLNDHRTDSRQDFLDSKYNPINQEVWDYESYSSSLKEKILKVSCKYMDDILSIDDIKGYWDA